MLVEVPGGNPELVLNLAGKSGKIIGVDPATGKKLWSRDCNNDGYVCSSVVSHDGVVYAIAGRSGRSVAVKARGSGEVKALWTNRNDSRVNSPVDQDWQATYQTKVAMLRAGTWYSKKRRFDSTANALPASFLLKTTSDVWPLGSLKAMTSRPAPVPAWTEAAMRLDPGRAARDICASA
jgi:hypothetical protein